MNGHEKHKKLYSLFFVITRYKKRNALSKIETDGKQRKKNQKLVKKMKDKTTFDTDNNPSHLIATTKLVNIPISHTQMTPLS